MRVISPESKLVVLRLVITPSLSSFKELALTISSPPLPLPKVRESTNAPLKLQENWF